MTGNLPPDFLQFWAGECVSCVSCVCACAEVHTRLNTHSLSNALLEELFPAPPTLWLWLWLARAVFPFAELLLPENFQISGLPPPTLRRGNCLRMFLALLRGYIMGEDMWETIQPAAGAAAYPLLMHDAKIVRHKFAICSRFRRGRELAAER